MPACDGRTERFTIASTELTRHKNVLNLHLHDQYVDGFGEGNMRRHSETDRCQLVSITGVISGWHDTFPVSTLFAHVDHINMSSVRSLPRLSSTNDADEYMYEMAYLDNLE